MAFKKNLSRRNFLKMTGAAGAMAASSLPLSQLWAATRRQDAVGIDFLGWGGIPEDEGVQAAIEVFQQENPGITVGWRHVPDTEWTQVFLADVAAGTEPDTSFIPSDTYETFRQQGLLMDITDQIKNDPLLGQENYFVEPQESNRSSDSDGRWHGIGSTWVAHHIYYNAALFDELGITPPGFKDEEIWEWDTFLEVAKQLTVDANGRHPDDSGFDPDNIERWGVQWPMWWLPIASAVHANGGTYVDPAEPRLTLDSPEALEAMQNLIDLIHVHHVAPQTASLSTLGMTNTQMIDTGRLGMAIDGSWALSWMNPSTVTVGMGTGALPKMTQAAALMQAHFHSVLSTTEHPEEAWQWVRFLATPFYQTQFLKIGLWLPSLTELSTEEGLATWLTEGIHTENYRDFVTDYLPAHGATMRIPAGYVEAASNFINPAFTAMEAGTPAEEAMVEAVAQANDIIAAAQS